MKTALMLVAVLALARIAAAQNADDYRGGWRTDAGEAHTYQFSIRGDKVRGVYCTYCADATTLAFIDGTFGPSGITFDVTHVNADGSIRYKDKAVATFRNGRLMVSGTSGARGGGKFERVLIKDPRGPDPIPAKVSVLPRDRPAVPANVQRRNPDGADGLAYIPPGPWKSKLTEKDVVGVWLGFGVGYEWGTFSLNQSVIGSSNTDATWSGFEFANLQLGADYHVAPKVALAPFLSVSFGQFRHTSTKTTTGMTSNTMDEDVTDTSVHEWILIGVRAAFMP